MLGYIYWIRNILNNKRYVGSSFRDVREKEHWDLLEDRNDEHHSIHLQRAYNKYSKENFEFKIIEKIEYTSEQELLDKEQEYMNLYRTLNSMYGYNCRPASRNLMREENPDNWEIVKHKISVSNTGKKASDAAKKKMSDAKKGKPGYPRTDEHKKIMSDFMKSDKNPAKNSICQKKMSDAKKGIALKEAHRNNISESVKASFTDERRKAVGDFHRGRKRSQSTCDKISTSNKGRVRSEEFKRKISDTMILKRKHDSEWLASQRKRMAIVNASNVDRICTAGVKAKITAGRIKVFEEKRKTIRGIQIWLATNKLLTQYVEHGKNIVIV
jgi:group I intron endonuclease